MGRIKRNKILVILGIFFVLANFSLPPFVYAAGDNTGGGTGMNDINGGNGLITCGKGEAGGNDCNFQKFYDLIASIWTFLLKYVLAPVATIAILFAGFKYVMAQGNPGEIQKAHDIFYYTVVGMLIAFAAWLVVNAILSALGVDTAFNFLGK